MNQLPDAAFGRAALDALTAHVAVLDSRGVIVQTNQAWMAFASGNQVSMRPDMLGVNYLEICDAAAGAGAETAHAAARGIRDVLSGSSREFLLEYPCHSPERKRWFNMRITRLETGGRRYAVVSHEDISNVKQAEEAVRQRESQLELQAARLEEANAALRVLLRQRQEDRRELEERVSSQVAELVRPYMERLADARLQPEHAALLDIARANLGEIVSPFASRLSSPLVGLTPSEMRIAGLIKDGKTSKEIAAMLSLSVRTVEFHRAGIRKKLGLSGPGSNLRARLMSLA